MIRPTAAILIALMFLCARQAHTQDLPAGAILRIGSSKFVHGGEIRALAFSPDGKLVVSANADFRNPIIRVWDVETGREVKNLKGHKNPVTRLAFLPGDPKVPATLVSGGADSTIRFWNIKTGEELPQIINHPGPVTDMTIAPDGKQIASGSSNAKHIFLWDASTGNEKRRWEAHENGVALLRFGPDGKTVASSGGTKSDPRVGPNDKQLALWDATTGKLLKHFSGLDTGVLGLALSPDGKTLIAGGQFFRNGSPIWWDTESGKQIHNPRASCYGITVTPDGKTIAVADTSAILFFDAETAAAQQPLQHKHRFYPKAMAFSPDGNTLATAGDEGRIVLWDARRRTEKKEEGSLSQAVRAVDVSPDGKAIMTIGGDGVLFWDRTSGKSLGKLESSDRRPGFAWTGRFLPDNRTVLLANVRDEIGFWTWSDGKHQRTVTFEHKLANIRSVTPDGSLFVTASHSVKDIIIWDASGNAVKTLPAPVNNKNVFVRAATISPNGEHLLAVGLFDHQVYDVESGKAIHYKKFSGFAPAFSPGGVLLAMWALKSGHSVGLIETATGKEVANLPAGNAASMAEQIVFSPDGRLLVLVESGPRSTDPSSVKVFAIATGKVVKTLAGHRGKVTMAAFTPDGKAVVTGSEDATALVWDLADAIAAEKIDVKSAWRDLAKADRRAAYLAFCRMRAVPADTIPLLKTELAKPAPVGELEKLRRIWAVRLLEDLKSAPARELLADLARSSKDAQAAITRLKRSEP